MCAAILATKDLSTQTAALPLSTPTASERTFLFINVRKKQDANAHESAKRKVDVFLLLTGLGFVIS